MNLLSLSLRSSFRFIPVGDRAATSSSTSSAPARDPFPYFDGQVEEQGPSSSHEPCFVCTAGNIKRQLENASTRIPGKIGAIML